MPNAVVQNQIETRGAFRFPVIRNIFSLLMLCSFLAACSDTVFVNYQCEPEGATLYEEGVRNMGRCPVQARYNPTAEDDKDGRLYTKPVMAIWSTGASVTVPSVSIDLNTTHKAYFNFIRPKTVVNEAIPEEGVGADFTRKRTAFDSRPTSTRPDQDAFESFDRITSCAFYNLIDAVYAECE